MMIIIYITVIFAVIAGVYCPPWFPLFVLTVSVLYTFMKKKVLRNLLSLTIIFLIFFIYTNNIVRDARSDYQLIKQMNGASVKVEGVIKKVYNYGFILKIREDPQLASKKLIVYKKAHGFIVGDTILVTGKLQVQEDDDNLSLITRPVAKLLPRQLIRINKSKLTVIFKLKRLMIKNLNIHLPEYYANFLTGLLIGVNGIELDKDLQNVFLNLGLLHMLVVSGAQVALLTSILIKILAVFDLPKSISFIFILLFNSMFLLFVGGDISVLRAVIMMQITVFLNYSNRQKTSLQVLSLTGIIMLCFSPGMLFSLSYILSFCATFAVVEISPRIQTMLEDNPYIPNILKEPLAISLGPILATSPVIFLVNHRFDVLSLFANILLGPLVEVIVIVGFLGLLLSLVIPIVAWSLLQFVFGLMVIVKIIADAMFSFSMRSLYFRHAFMFNVVIYYLFFICWIYNRKLFRQYHIIWATILVAGLLSNIWFISRQPIHELYLINNKSWFSSIYVNRNRVLMVVSERNPEAEAYLLKHTYLYKPDIIISLDDDSSIGKFILWGDVELNRDSHQLYIKDKLLTFRLVESFSKENYNSDVLFLPKVKRVNRTLLASNATIIVAPVGQSEGHIISNKKNIVKVYMKGDSIMLEAI